MDRNPTIIAPDDPPDPDAEGAGTPHAQPASLELFQFAPLSNFDSPTFNDAFDEIRRANAGLGRASKYIGDLSNVKPISVDASKNLNTAVKFFEDKGWSHNQAVGIAANLYAESGLNPTEFGDNGAAFGVAQWHSDRREEFAKKFGHSMANSTFEEQLSFVHYELTEGNEQRAGKALRQTMDVRSAAAVVSTDYERPAATSAEEVKRAGIAAGIDNRIASTEGDLHRREQLNLVHANGNSSAPDAPELKTGKLSDDKVASAGNGLTYANSNSTQGPHSPLSRIAAAPV